MMASGRQGFCFQVLARSPDRARAIRGLGGFFKFIYFELAGFIGRARPMRVSGLNFWGVFGLSNAEMVCWTGLFRAT